MLLKKTISLVILFSTIYIQAQNFELEKVTVAELTEKEHPKDPSAVAAILYSKGEVSFEYSQGEGFSKKTKVKTRIKIYKKEGYEWANEEIKYYIGNGNFNEVVSFSNAVTYNLVDGKIEKIKIKSDGEFDQKINEYWGLKKISLPNIKEGSIIEYEYIIRTNNISDIDAWEFQTSIPVNYSEFKISIPEYFVYKPIQKGFIFPKVTEVKNQKFLSITDKERIGSGFSGTTTKFTTQKLDYQETTTTYVAENFPALKDEKFVNNIDNYTSSIAFELSMLKYPNEPYKVISTDWESVVKTIYENENFGAELNKTGYFEADIDALLNGVNTLEERILTIFQYVKSKVKWNDYLGYSCSDGVKSAYKNNTGNVAEINLMLTAMLRYAGITANPVLLSTRSNGIAVFPNRTAYNYVIAAVENQDNFILLDATDRYTMPNVLPIRDLNWFGRLIRKNGTSAQIDLTPKMVSKEITNMKYTFNGNDSFEGKIRMTYTDYDAMIYREQYAKVNQNSYLELLERENNDIEINDYVRENELDLLKPLVETYSFKDSKDIEIINNEIYITPELFLTPRENPFKMEERKYPIDFSFPMQSKNTIIIDIPEGYTVSSLPQNLNITTGDNIANFKYKIASTETSIQLLISTDINSAIVPAEYYEVIKDFFQQMVDKENEKIILKKI